MSAREDREAEEIATKFRAAGFAELSDDYLRGHYSGRSTWGADGRKVAANFAVSEVREALAGDDIALVRDVGLFRSIRRAEALKQIAAVEREAVDASGVLELPPGDPRLLPAWEVVNVNWPWYRYRLGPDFKLETILNEHVSLFRGYSGGRQKCEYSGSVTGLDAGGCRADHNRGGRGKHCCAETSVGWVIDLWRERSLILVWRACSGCLAFTRDTRPAPTTDASRNVHDPTGEHAKRIDELNAQKARIAIGESERNLEEAWEPHPDWKRGEDGRWHSTKEF